MNTGSTQFLEALNEIDAFLREIGVAYCIVGGFAVCFRGEVRATRDIDISVLADLKTEETIVNALLSRFKSRFSDARQFAAENKVVFINVNGVSVDVLLGLSNLDYQAITQATRIRVDEQLLVPVCRAEHLIIQKCLSGCEKDMLDVRSIISRNPDSLDIDYVESVLRECGEIITERDLLRLFRKQLELVEKSK